MTFMSISANTSFVVDKSVGVFGVTGGMIGLYRDGRVWQGHTSVVDFVYARHTTPDGSAAILPRTSPYKRWVPKGTVLEIWDEGGRVLRTYTYPGKLVEGGTQFFQVFEPEKTRKLSSLDKIDEALHQYGLRTRPFERWYRRRSYFQVIQVENRIFKNNHLLEARERAWCIIKKPGGWRALRIVIAESNHLAMANIGLIAFSAIDIGVSLYTGHSMAAHVMSRLGCDERKIFVGEILAGAALSCVGGWKGVASWGIMMGAALSVEIFS